MASNLAPSQNTRVRRGIYLLITYPLLPCLSITQDVRLADLQQVTVLGAGGFGKVSLVKYQNQYFALKQMNKAYILDQRLVMHVHREKNVSA